MLARVLIRDQPAYRRQAFCQGLQASGYRLAEGFGAPSAPGDVLVIWNRYGTYHDQARQWEAQGGIVLVAENGYIGNDENGVHRYALAIRGHNASGEWYPGDGSRFEALGLQLAPWRTTGDHIVVRGQRGIGLPPLASPPNWHQNVAVALRKITRRPVHVIEHPGSSAPTETSWKDYLQGAHCLVIWASSVGVKALTLGVPVICLSPHWICKPAAAASLEDLENLEPYMDDARRLKALQDMAWGQWTIAEIAAGLPFRHLLQRGAQ